MLTYPSLSTSTRETSGGTESWNMAFSSRELRDQIRQVFFRGHAFRDPQGRLDLPHGGVEAIPIRQSLELTAHEFSPFIPTDKSRAAGSFFKPDQDIQTRK